MRYRKVIHVDMDAFFASVEQRDHPELRGKPIAVGGGGRRGVVTSPSYEARRYGVRSAMPGFIAKQKCPHITFVRSNFEAYSQASENVMEILHGFTDKMQRVSVDEAYLDVTNHEYLSATDIAKEIRRRIYKETQLTASAGVSINKFIAKVASEYNKPDGLTVVTPTKVAPFLEHLPIEKFHGIGPATAERMKKMGIHTGRDLKLLSETDLTARFGKVGERYYNLIRGIDYRPVKERRRRKSIGAEHTFFKNVIETDELQRHLDSVICKVYRRMEKAGILGKTITIKIKYNNFQVQTISKTFREYIRDRDQLCCIALRLLQEARDWKRPVRLLGLQVRSLNIDERLGEDIQMFLPGMGNHL